MSFFFSFNFSKLKFFLFYIFFVFNFFQIIRSSYEKNGFSDFIIKKTESNGASDEESVTKKTRNILARRAYKDRTVLFNSNGFLCDSSGVKIENKDVQDAFIKKYIGFEYDINGKYPNGMPFQIQERIEKSNLNHDPKNFPSIMDSTGLRFHIPTEKDVKFESFRKPNMSRKKFNVGNFLKKNSIRNNVDY